MPEVLGMEEVEGGRVNDRGTFGRDKSGKEGNGGRLKDMITELERVM